MLECNTVSIPAENAERNVGQEKKGIFFSMVYLSVNIEDSGGVVSKKRVALCSILPAL